MNWRHCSNGCCLPAWVLLPGPRLPLAPAPLLRALGFILLLVGDTIDAFSLSHTSGGMWGTVS